MNAGPRQQATALRPDEPGERLPLVTAVVVHYNGAEHITACVEALLRSSYPALQVIVVDNASTDGSPAVLRGLEGLHSELSVVWNERNLGYAGGVNSALPAARGEFLAVLNADITAQPGWLQPLVAFLQLQPEVAAVNPLILLSDGQRINAIGQDIHITGVPFNRFLGKPRLAAGTDPIPVHGVHGSAFLTRRSLLDRLGGLDSRGFLYNEDVNLSWALRLMGYDLYCVPQSAVCHDYSLSMDPAKLYLLERNRWSMLLSYLERWSLLALLPALAATECMVFGFCFLRGRSYVGAKLAAYRWIAAQWSHIRRRRRFFRSLRVVPGWRLLRSLRWSVAWGQIASLCVQREPSRQRFAARYVEAWDRANSSLP